MTLIYNFWFLKFFLMSLFAVKKKGKDNFWSYFLPIKVDVNLKKRKIFFCIFDFNTIFLFFFFCLCFLIKLLIFNALKEISSVLSSLSSLSTVLVFRIGGGFVLSSICCICNGWDLCVL